MTYDTTSDAFLSLLREFLAMAPNCAPRGMPCCEQLNYQFTVTRPSDGPMITASVSRNARMAKYLQEEFAMYESGEDSLEAFAKHAKMWRDVTVGDRINSAYGRMIYYDKSLATYETPWQWCVRKLQEDPDTRQAILQYLQPRHFQEPVRDFVCTTHCAFHLRGDALHCTTVMRSNDLVRGMAYDVPWFNRCQLRMARELNVNPGTYTHYVHSLHLYERDRDTALEMIG
jgi:thymidylate synthase